MSRFPMHTFQQDAILARLSQALVALEVSNVKSLTSEQCDKLQCGDVVVKKDNSGEHSYVVTFKSDTGMCLTYMDASVIETQSYDLVDDEWVYNSEDKSELPINIGNPIQIFNGTITLTDSLTIVSSYCKVVRNFNELQFIFNCRVKNETESTITISNDSPIVYFEELPAEINDKIYGHDGLSLSDASGNISIACTVLMISTPSEGMDSSFNPRFVNLYYQKAVNRIYLYLEGGNIGIAADTTRDFEARISLAL